MRAAVFRGVGKPLAIETQDDPTPGSGDVVVKVHRCGVCGTDLHLTDGHNAPPVPAGTVLGHEYAGEVVALGKDVSNLEIGDRVAALPFVGCGKCDFCRRGEPIWCSQMRANFGGYAEFVRTGADTCLKLPENLSFDDGALVEPLSVALHGVRQAGDIKGKHVMVMGAGPIGLGAIFWARRFGASRITVIEGSPSRIEIAGAMGADEIRPPVAEILAAPTEYVFGVGDNVGDNDESPEVVFECVGKAGLLAQAINFVRPRGTILSVGCCMVPDSFVPIAANTKELTLRFPIAYTTGDFQTSIEAFDSGAIEPRRMITDVVSLDDAPVAFEALRSPSHMCKVLVAPW